MFINRIDTTQSNKIMVYGVNGGQSSGSGTDQILTTNAAITPSDASGIYGGAFGNGTLFMPNTAGKVYAFTVSGSTFTSAWSSALTFPFPGLQMAVSSNGALNTIIWGTAPTTTSAEVAQAAGTLYALNPATGAKIWSSDDHAGDTLGTLSKYAIPTVANGRVYVATQSNKIMVYGLTSPSQMRGTFTMSGVAAAQ